jgi:phage baseplate assembly protein V
VISTLRAFTRPMLRRILLTIGRGVVRLANDDGGIQLLQVDLLKGETRDRLERFQDYGFTSVPHPGAEAVVGFVGGNRDHGLVLAVGDRRFRVRGLKSGEVAIYSDEGDLIHFRRGREIHVTCGNKVQISCPLVRIVGDLEVTGEITDRAGADGTSMEFIRNRYDQHVHGLPGGGTSDPPTPLMP